MKYIIDTDPGIDDAIAIMLGYLNHLDILGFTLATGNIAKEKSQNNLKTIQDILRSDIKMYNGTIENACNALSAEYAHGEDGLGNVFMPKSIRTFEEKSAEDFIIEAAHKYQDNLTIICLGPLTNLASALQKDETIASKIKEVVLMGTTYNPKNIEPYKEFNIKIDPKAAHRVLTSPFKQIKIITHEIGIQTFIEKEYIQSLRTSKNRISKFLYVIGQKYMEFSYDHYKVIGLTTPDPVTIASVLDKNIVKFEPCTVSIKDDLSYIELASKSDIYVSTSIDIERFKTLFKNTFN